MATSLISTGVQFPDSSVQTTAAGALTIKATSSYTSSGTSTWTKASGATGDTVVAVVIGGGGGGAYAIFTSNPYGGGTYSSATGGGGGGVAVIAMPYEDCPSTVSVTVGAGGGARTSQGDGNNGSTSSFGNFAKATGGTGGKSTGTFSAYLRGGGIGGGPMFGNSSNNADNPDSETFIGTSSKSGIRNGGAGRACVDSTSGGFSLSYTSLIPAGLTGGGGSVFYNGTTWYTQNSTGGTGRIFGDGGSGQTSGAAATAGVAPGGGGGGSSTGNSGAGAVGAVYIYIVAGFVPASTILDRASSNKYTISF